MRRDGPHSNTTDTRQGVPAALKKELGSEKSAMWFSRLRRNQGRSSLFHGHLKPVLLRDREHRYVKWEGTIWHSTRIDDLMKEEATKRRRALEGTGPRLPHQRTDSVRSNVAQRPGRPQFERSSPT